MSARRRTSRPASRRWMWSRAGSFLLTLVVVLLPLAPALMETWDEFLQVLPSGLLKLVHLEEGCSLQEVVAPQSFSSWGLYYRVFELRKGVSSPALDRVVTIGIESDLFPVQSDRCIARRFTADLIRTVAAAGPSVIAIDKYYSDDACKANEDEKLYTQELQAAVRDVSQGVRPSEAGTADPAAVAPRPIPVVIGSGTEAMDDEPCIRAQKPLDLTSAAPAPGGGVRYGYVRLNQNPLNLPLRWNLEGNTGPPLYPCKGSTFSVAVADAAAAGSGTASFRDRWFERIFRADQERVEHPFAYVRQDVSRLTYGRPGSGEEVEVSSLHYMCQAGHAFLSNLRLSCAPGEENPAIQQQLSGKIVVIGSQDEMDRVNVLGESVYGYKLQARYIAALLGHAYLREWPLLLRFLWALLQTFVVERAFEVGREHGFGLHKVPDLFWPESSEKPWVRRVLNLILPRRGLCTRIATYSAPANVVVLVLLLMPFLAAAIGLWMGWMPPLSFLVSTVTLAILKVSAMLSIEDERLRHTHPEIEEAKV